MSKIKQNFDFLKINIASPQRIKEWSQRILPNGEVVGEVITSETLNYRTLKPEPYGLLCQKIFGPVKSWECFCGRYKYKIKKKNSKSIFCEICGVELTDTRVRRHRMGYINLNMPVTHVWYLKGSPSYISILLDISLKKLEKIIYFHDESFDDEEGFLVKFLENAKSAEKSANLTKEDGFSDFSKTTQSKININSIFEQTAKQLENPADKSDDSSFDFSTVTLDDILTEGYYNNGTHLILELLENLDLNDEIIKARNELLNSSQTKQTKIVKRIRVIENFIATKSNPAWMILTILPVLPPSLRPILELENGRLATSDLNEHYKRIITRNNRLKLLFDRYAPLNVICNEKRMLQEAVDALIDNGRRGGRIAYSLNNRPLKCLADNISGKQGRFRQNLLGKRVDYSGRSVIIVGPNLKLHQCGLPYEMAIELFNPFLMYYLIEFGYARTIKSAKYYIETESNIIWTILQNIAKEYPILLNRAPTLHRLGIQAFEPIITTGRAIQLHPLVCSAFNADFDGDQMAVHVPLSEKSKAEAKNLMLASLNFLSPATGRPILTPSQDMVLGCYYLTTRAVTNLKGEYSYFLKFSDVMRAFEHDQLDLHSSIWVRFLGNTDHFKLKKPEKIKKLANNMQFEIYDELQIKRDASGKILTQYIKTTPGRILLNEIIASAIKSKTFN